MILKKEIQIKTYNTSIGELNENNIKVNKVFQDTPYYGPYKGLGINGSVYINYDVPDDEKIDIISNDMDLCGDVIKEGSATLEFNDIEYNDKKANEFGLSTDCNINMQQINFEMEALNNILHMDTGFWCDLDKNFHCASKVMTIEKIIETGNVILKNGYYASLVCYIDSNIRVIYHDYVYYVSKMLGIKSIPVVFLTYYDIKYVESINPDIYNDIKKLPSNPLYNVIDSVDISSHLITNYSDKRDMVAKHMNSEIKLPTDSGYKITQLFNYKEILPFMFDESMNEENEKMFDAIKNCDYDSVPYNNKGHFMECYIPYGAELHWYLVGYMKTHEIQNSDNRNLNDYNQADYDMNNFNKLNLIYNYSVCSIFNNVSDSNLYIFEDVPYYLIGFCNINNDMLNSSLSIKQLKSK